MKRFQLLLRGSALCLALCLGGCMVDVIPGPDTADASCVLLCALQRRFVDEPAPAPPPSMASPIATPRRRAVMRSHVVPRLRATRLGPAQVPLRRPRRRPVSQVSVVPQAPPHMPQPAPVAMVPSGPVPVAVAPPPASTEPARSLSQAIPGSAGIMMPDWRGQ